MRYFVQGQGMRIFNPQEYIVIFRGLKFEHNAEMGETGDPLAGPGHRVASAKKIAISAWILTILDFPGISRG